MHLITTISIFLILTVSALAAEEGVLTVDIKADQVSSVQELGSLKIAGVGMVKLTASREGKRLVVQASGEEGKVIGRAESVIGPKETLIYVTTPGGLKKLTILWKDR